MKKKRAFLYARVSTDKQNSIPQQFEDMEQLCRSRGFVVVRKFKDLESGTKVERESYQEMLDLAHQGKCDVIVVWKFDRFGRSMKELINRFQEFEEKGIDFVSYQERGIDTTGPFGKAIFALIAAFAEIEADNTRRRIKSGMLYAQKNGTKSGRPIGKPTVKESDDKDLRECIRLALERLNGNDRALTATRIQKRTNISKGTYYKVWAVLKVLHDDNGDKTDMLADIAKEKDISDRLMDDITRTYNMLTKNEVPA